MNSLRPTVSSLVLYKSRPARVLATGEKIEIDVGGGATKRVRPKDIDVLHPGPIQSLGELAECEGEALEAWELLEGGTTDLKELAELVYRRYDPATAWAAWQLVADGVYFRGTPEAVEARAANEVRAEQEARLAKEKAEREWNEFLDRLRASKCSESDREHLSDVEQLAYGRREASRILQILGHQQTPQNAHRLLEQSGFWPRFFNPYPGRVGVASDAPLFVLGDLPEERRRDLTGLDAFAVDDEGNEDPDDAISWDGDRLWVHIADVAALVAAGSDADQEARARGANLYLPEGPVPMLPVAVTQRLGLGLTEESPALSVGFRLGPDAMISDVEIVPSWVRVHRHTYRDVNERIGDEPFATLYARTQAYRERRLAAGSASIDLPEVSLRVVDSKVMVRALPRYSSRDLVTDAMLMAGEAVGRYCLERGIAIPYASQPPPDERREPNGLAEMYAYRRKFKPSQLGVEPEPHAGLGLDVYTRATSPLRRYSDLLVHQQLRAHFFGGDLLDGVEVAARCAVAETGSGQIRRAERMSNQHWKVVYLAQNPGWRGRGVVVDVEDNRATFLIPDLAMETRIRLREVPELNADRVLRVREVDVPDLTAWFHVRS